PAFLRGPASKRSGFRAVSHREGAIRIRKRKLTCSKRPRSTVNGSNPIVRGRNSGNVCPDSNMIAAYCPQFSFHGLAIVATKFPFPRGCRPLSKHGRSRLPPTFSPNRLILMSRSLRKAAKTAHVQLALLKHLPPHQACRRSDGVRQLSILARRLIPQSNLSMENKLIKNSN